MDEQREKDGYNYYGYPAPHMRGDDEVESATEADIRRPPAPVSESGRPQWTVSRRTKHAGNTSFRAVFTSFLAGAVVVGSLMFVSDRMNLFSTQAGNDNIGSSNTVETVALRNGGGGEITTAADVIRPNTIAQLVEVASPAVVKIETYAKSASRSGGLSQDWFKEFFGDYFEFPEAEPKPNGTEGDLAQVGSGSGFFFDAKGYILTNEHVIHGADEVRVVVSGRKDAYKAKVLGTAYESDLAVLKIEGTSAFPVLPLASSDKINVGDWVIAIGNPYEFDHTVTVGVLSAKERQINIPDRDGTRRYQTLLQTDASINPGNSGGPLLNVKGEVIGINTAVNAQAQGIGFAIPTSTISGMLESLKANKPIPRPYIGVRMSDIPDEYMKDLGLSSKDGAFINEVMFGSPAYKAGLQVYDVVTAADGSPIKSANDLQKAVGKKKPGDKMVFNVLRNKDKLTITVAIGDMNTQKKK